MKYFNLEGALFSLLYQFGIDLSAIENTSELSYQDCFLISVAMIFCLVFILLIIRGLFYALREMFGSCLR